MESSKEIEHKLAHLRTYVPFVERMISKLEARSQQVGTGNNQLERLQGLHRFLTTPVPRAPRMEMLEKMEAVIRNMHEKVQKATGKPEPGPSVRRQSPSHGPSLGQMVSPGPSSTSGHRPLHGSDSSVGLSQGPGMNQSFSHNQGSGPISDGGGNRRMSSSRESMQGQGPNVSHNSGNRQFSGYGSGQQVRPHPARPRPDEWQSSRDNGSERREKERIRETDYDERRGRGGDLSRESSYERSRGREVDRGSSRHNDRSRDRDSDRYRDRDSDRNRTKSYDKKREHERYRDDRSGSRDGRNRNSGDRERDFERSRDYERSRERRGSSREQEREKNRDLNRSLSSRERDYERDRERETHHLQRQRSASEQDYQEDGKQSSKRNSLLDLPMPPSMSNTDLPSNVRELGNVSQQNEGKLVSSREKLNKLYGLSGEHAENSQSSEKRGLLRAPGSWRDEVRARGESFFSHMSSSDGSFQRDDSHSQDDTNTRVPFQAAKINDHIHSRGGSSFQEQSHWRGNTSQSVTAHSGPPQQTYHQPESPSDVPDTPMSPDDSSSPAFVSTDTPQSPDMDASFSPIPTSDDVKTIPLESINQTKPIDMENIKKALAQIRAQTGSSSGPSYRYEDFVGPAGKSNAEDEPYDPEEVWNNQDTGTTKAQWPISQANVMSGRTDTDLRQIHHSLLPQSQSYQGRPHGPESEKVIGRAGPQASFATKATDSGISTSESIASIPLPHRQATSHQSVTNKGSQSLGNNIVGTSGAGFYRDNSNTRPSDPRSRESSGDIDMRHAQPPLPKSQPPLLKIQPPLPKSQPPPPLPKPYDTNLPKSAPPPLPTPLQSKPVQPPLPPKVQPPLPKSPPPQTFATIGATKEATEKEGQKRLDNIRARIANTAGEFIKPGQRGVAASQMEKYKLKRQISGSRDPKTSQIAPLTKDHLGKPDNQGKGKEPVSVLDILLPENSAESEPIDGSPRGLQSPSQDSCMRDPRFKSQQELPLSKDARARDPRLSAPLPSSVTRDPRQQMNRDPRQDVGGFPGRETREDVNRFSPNPVRDPRQDSVKYGSVGPQPPRDPRQEPSRFAPTSVSGAWEPRHEANQFPGSGPGIRGQWQEHGGFAGVAGPVPRDPRQEPGHFPGVPSAVPRDPRQDARTFPNVTLPQFRDPRMASRVERPLVGAWNQQPPPTPPTSGPVVSTDMVDPSPTQSASGSLIGQTFTCLMMRGLPPFVHSNHIYRFFQEYILRDMSIELDNHYNCKGTAYIHFPSHASAREALEQMNGQPLNGYPTSLRICTVGVLRQAKNMYEQLNRDREAQLGLPERPRGNGNPFFKPKPKEAISKPVPPPAVLPTPVSAEKPPVIETPVREPSTVEPGSSTHYSELCGVKVPPKSSVVKSSFKIPKIKKAKAASESTKTKRDSNKESTQKKTKSSKKSPDKGKSHTDKSVADDSSDSDDIINRKIVNKKNRKFKKIIIESDTESDTEEVKKVTERTEKESMRSNTRDRYDDDDDDECFMVIDETVVSDTEETEDSEVSSSAPDDLAGHSLGGKTKEKGKVAKSKKSIGRGRKSKPKKNVLEAKKVGKKGQTKKETVLKKPRGKKVSDKYLQDNAYKPELDLQSSVGMKLTRQTQGELEELIKEKTKLKVIIPVPHRYVVNLFDEDKLKKRGGRRQTVEVSQPLVETKAPEVTPIVEEKETIPVIEKSIEAPVKNQESVALIQEPYSYRKIKALVMQKSRHALGMPTARKGRKRNVMHIENRSLEQGKKIGGPHFDKDKVDNERDLKSEKGKRSRTSPSKDQPPKKSRLDHDTPKEVLGNMNKMASNVDIFDTNTSSDDLPDLTQITPSLLDVDPTISSALPDVTVLAKVLSPPHVIGQTSDSSFSGGVESDGDSSPGKLQIVENDQINKDYQILDEIIRKDSKEQTANELPIPGKEEHTNEDSNKQKLGDIFHDVTKDSSHFHDKKRLQDSCTNETKTVEGENFQCFPEGNGEDLDDDTASVGMVSTSSFVDDASIVSSEGRELKTPDSGSSRKAKRSKTSHIPPELRRVTRGSVVEPLTTEIIEWDDGGIVDLFQCDLCDYVGRHIAYHLVNYHTEREMPCEFKKEDFPPVIKDHVGPPCIPDDRKEVSLDLSWIPENMTFEKNVTCNECDYISNSRFDLVYHVLEHKPLAAHCVYHCRLCNYMSEHLENFYNHVTSHTGEYRYSCELCGNKTYKKSLLEAHHKECHGNQQEKCGISDMILENGWPYIHVCKTCMFVRVSQTLAEDHVKQRHNGKADIHKANMTRPVTLYSEQWKAKTEMEGNLLRPKPKGRKRKRGKKAPDLEVFVGEGGEEEMEEEIEEKAKQLVDRIASNIHTTTSAEEAQKRMLLLNSISKKLDEEEEEEQDYPEKEESSLSSQIVSETNSSSLPGKAETLKAPDGSFRDMSSGKASESPYSLQDKKSIVSTVDLTGQLPSEKDSLENVMEVDDEGKIGDDSDSDTESVLSVLDPNEFEDVTSAKTGSLQETIRKLSANLGDKLKTVAKPPMQSIQQTERTSDDMPVMGRASKDKPVQQPYRRDSGDRHEDDSDSDNLVICEDDPDDKEHHVPEDEKQQDRNSNQVDNSESFSAGVTLASTNNSEQAAAKMPKLRIRPAHQLFDIGYSTKTATVPSSTTPFKCAVADCNYTSTKHTDLIKHIIAVHGPYKCISSGCTFVTTSSEMFSIHIKTSHPKLHLFVCPFHCQDVFYKCADLINHLTLQHAIVDTANDINTEDSDDPGFLRIESVSTLDPMIASQMFGEDYNTPGPPIAKSGTGQNSSTSPEIKMPSTSGTQVVHAKASSDIGLTPTVSMKPPAVVTLDEDEEEGAVVCTSRVQQKPPPGMATLPKNPPTVPVLSVFQVYQPADIFRILTTKLAPEVFKCMFTGCVFAEDDPEAFLQHMEVHGGRQRCCYCLMMMDSPKVLIDHIITEHSHCQFQCKYCLYRAFTKIYMGVHLKNFHPYEEPRYIKVGTIQPQHPPNPPIDQFVRPYKCSYNDCQYRTVDAEAFKGHVLGTHGQFAVLSCDFCYKHLHVQPLIDHMREHQMNEYQCPYCLHGDAEKERLLNHLLNCHPGRPGKVLLRKQISNASAPESCGPVRPEPSDSGKSDKSMKPDGENQAVGSGNISTASNKGSLQGSWNMPERKVSRSLSQDSESRMESNSRHGEGGSSPIVKTPSTDECLTTTATLKTGLSSHALYRCGNQGCEYSSSTQVLLREHLQVCDLAQDSTVLKCHHCGKQCRHLSTLFEHLRVHGPKRYRCGVTGCDYKATMVHYFKNHMKQIHKCSGFKQVLKDPKIKDPETQEYVVYPKDAVPPTKEPHRKRKNEYSVEDIPRIPKAHVSYQDLKCYYCHFVSKVRLNLIKHIKLHKNFQDGIPKRLFKGVASLSPIPTKQPVNPVPCLERKELMFDKMMNLAGSSFEAKKKKEDVDLRAKNPIPTDEQEKLPKHVPDERLYSCGIVGCNYLSCDDMMLKYHIRTLHADISSFPCPHCIDATITVEKMSSHFKLHGDRLYRCGWCPYISSRRNVVERHMKDKHPTKKPFDFVIRETEEADSQKKEEKIPEEPVLPAVPAIPQIPQWQCGLCKFCSVTQQEMVNHTSLKHAIKSQYKCGYCSVRSSVRASFDAHFASKHLNQPFRVLCMYYRIDSEDIEPINLGNEQHCHEPLWKRNDPDRIRHIRGILIDDDPETKKKQLKRTGTGKPDKGEYVCPLCRSFKTACVATFRSHLCREADYVRYECAECGISNSLLPSLQRHFTKMHHKQFTTDSYLHLPVDEEKETWVEGIVSHQQQLIKSWFEKGGGEASDSTGIAQHSSPAKASTSRRSSGSAMMNVPSSEGSSQQGVVLHDSGSERGRFTCDTCGSECRSAAGLKSHTTAMHQARFKCHYCPFASNSEDAVKQHCTVKHPKLQNEVLDVSQRLKSQKGEDETTGLNLAVEEDSSGTTVSLQESNKVTEQDDDTNTKEVKPVETSAEAVQVDKPVEEKTDPPEVVKSYCCPFCPFISNTTSGLSHHKRTKHSDKRLYMCDHCSARFSTSYDVVRHNKWKHTNLKPQYTYLPEENATTDASKTEDDVDTISCDSNNSSATGIKDSTPTTSVNSLTSQQILPAPKSKKGKARKSFPNASLLKASQSKPSSEANVDSTNEVSSANRKSEPQVSYSCCHCSQQSNKIAMEEHMKKQHRDLPYQVRREEGDKVFTEVHVYKCIHCIAESISLAQAMDHWIQNHPLQDFKFQMLLRHCGEVSNQVVTSTTEDPPQTASSDEIKEPEAPEADTSRSTAAASSSVITSSSEDPSTKVPQPMKIAKQRASGKEMMSPHRSSLDTEDEEQSETSEVVDEKEESLVQTSSEFEDEEFIYKCGLCKKSSVKLEELEAHFRKIHVDRELTFKKMRKEAFLQIYRAEYECGHCGEKGLHAVLKRHHKTAHPNLLLKIARANQNVYFRCDVCCHVVKNLQSMRYHIRRHHPEADEFTFSKLTLGSPMRPPMKQPYKCNYCGDVGETLQEMQTHHAFLHSHLECSITNLMDEALSSVHSPTPSHSSGDIKNPPLVPLPIVSKCSSPQVADISSPAAEVKTPTIPKLKNTARKSMPDGKRVGGMKPASKLQPKAGTSSSVDDGFSSYGMPQPPVQMDNLYAYVNLGAGVPMRLTVQRLGKLIDLEPKVMVSNDKQL